MKKVLISLVLLAGFTAVITLNSCNKANTSTADPITTTATIKGNVTAEFDLTNTSAEKVVGTPAVSIIATYDAKDLIDNPNPAYNYGKRQVTAAVASTGDYTIVLPAGTKPFTVTLTAQDFTTDQTQTTTGNPRLRKIYKYSGATVSVQKDAISITDIYFNAF